MKINTLTTVGRPIDLSYPTNRAIAGACLLVMLGATLLQRAAGTAWTQSILWGAQAALSLFLAWALCRELDPDHDLSAFVAAGLCLGGLVLWGLPRLAAMFWLILVLRVVNRTTGLPAGVLDSTGVLGLGIWLSLQGNWGHGVITTVAFLLDSQLPARAPRQLVLAILSAAGTLTAAIIGPGLPWDAAPSLPGTLVALAITIPFLPVIWQSHSVTSVGDQTGEPLDPHRVRAAQIVALVVVVGGAFLGGIPSLLMLTPLWSAVLGAALYWFYRALKPSQTIQ